MKILILISLLLSSCAMTIRREKFVYYGDYPTPKFKRLYIATQNYINTLMDTAEARTDKELPDYPVLYIFKNTPNNVLGWAVVDEYNQSHIALSDTLFAEDQAYLPEVITHEVLHVLGFSHDYSCPIMAPSPGKAPLDEDKLFNITMRYMRNIPQRGMWDR